MDWLAFILGVFIALPALIAATTAAIVSWRNGQKADVIHGIVNSQRLEMMNKIEILERLLREERAKP